MKATKKEKRENIDLSFHPDLLTQPNVKVAYWEKNTFQRGLKPEETPFPQSPRVGPYTIDDPLYGAKNYFWCSCGMSQN